MTTTTTNESETTMFNREQHFEGAAISAAAKGERTLKVYPKEHRESSTEVMPTKSGSITLRNEGNFRYSIQHLTMYQEEIDEFWTRLERYCTLGREQFHEQEVKDWPRGGTYMSDAIHQAAQSTQTLRVYSERDEDYRTWLIIAPKGSITVQDTGNHWYSITFVNMKQEDADAFWAELDRYIEQNPHHSLEHHNYAQRRYRKFSQFHRRLMDQQKCMLDNYAHTKHWSLDDEARYQDISTILAVAGLTSYRSLPQHN